MPDAEAVPFTSDHVDIPRNMANSPPTYCPQDPGVETNLRCGRCDEPICPRCLVQTPVGARCPNCAAERKNPVFDPSAAETARAVTAAAIAGVAVAVLAWVLAFRIPVALYRYLLILAPAAAGWIIGSVTYRASGFKRNSKLQIASGAATLLSFMIMSLVMPMTIGGFIGLAVGMYYAIGRVKPPRGA